MGRWAWLGLVHPFPCEQGGVPACTPFHMNALTCPLLAHTGQRSQGGREVPGSIPVCNTLLREWGKGGARSGALHAPFPRARGGTAKGEGMPGAVCKWGRVELGAACPRVPRTYGAAAKGGREGPGGRVLGGAKREGEEGRGDTERRGGVTLQGTKGGRGDGETVDKGEGRAGGDGENRWQRDRAPHANGAQGGRGDGALPSAQMGWHRQGGKGEEGEGGGMPSCTPPLYRRRDGGQCGRGKRKGIGWWGGKVTLWRKQNVPATYAEVLTWQACVASVPGEECMRIRGTQCPSASQALSSPPSAPPHLCRRGVHKGMPLPPFPCLQHSNHVESGHMRARGPCPSPSHLAAPPGKGARDPPAPPFLPWPCCPVHAGNARARCPQFHPSPFAHCPWHPFPLGCAAPCVREGGMQSTTPGATLPPFAWKGVAHGYAPQHLPSPLAVPPGTRKKGACEGIRVEGGARGHAAPFMREAVH
ncbi:hypothetical protein EDB92DRAFT_1814281 [Lactarius akahatsu]|uniref:Uncharacterized protein n=1 Tax=Lactarius akahatsu TaxID=416441 RepID=A0AAD4LR87_9AGAM|nr:hypothetical protein EDB92DRAFT_1814281 [Lactarius akahatsu]